MNKIIAASLLGFLVLFNACSIINQIAQTQALQTCELSIKGLDRIKLAGIELKPGMTRSDLSAAQVIQLAGMFMANELPLAFDVLLQIDNPNQRQALLSRMDYTVFLDGREMLNGRLNESYSIPAAGYTVVPVQIQTDLAKLFSGQQTDALVNLAFRLAGGQGAKPVELQLKVKPYIEVGLRQIPYPGFLTLKKTF